MREIWHSIPAEKQKQDSLWTRWVLRPLSVPVSALALNLCISANTVSYISALFSIGGGILFSLNGFILPLAGALALNFFSVMDCVDGNIARITKTAAPWGAWADAVMGFVAYTAVFLATGVYLYQRTRWWPFLLVAGVTASANLLTRTAYQIYKNIEGETAHDSVSFERKLAENAGITGFMMPALVLCHVFTGMAVIAWFNLAFYGGGCLITLIKLARKAAQSGTGRGAGGDQ
jgi:phosphatidylglycerophosphate synthase